MAGGPIRVSAGKLGTVWKVQQKPVDADGHGMPVIGRSPDPLARMHTMTEKEVKSGTIDVKALLAGGPAVDTERDSGDNRQTLERCLVEFGWEEKSEQSPRRAQCALRGPRRDRLAPFEGGL